MTTTNNIPLTKDVVLYMVPFLEKQDILNMGYTCKLFLVNVANSEDIWRAWLTFHWPIDVLPVYQGILKNDEISWKHMALLPSQICVNEICKIHIRKRLEYPASSKLFFQFYCEVSAPHTGTKPPIASVILTSKEIDYEKYKESFSTNKKKFLSNTGNLYMQFTTKANTPLIIWKGEENIYSSYKFYVVDRMNNPPKIPLNSIYDDVRTSILSRTAFKEIGKFLHNDEQYYESRATTSYNYNTDHGYHRSGNAPTGFGSSTNKLIMPDIDAKSFVCMYAQFDPLEIYKKFMSPEPVIKTKFDIEK